MIFKQQKSGFTLIEIMIATVIMVLMVGLVIQITSEVLKAWSRSSGKLSAAAEARVALEILSADLEGAIMQKDGLEWLRSESEPIAGPSKSSTVALRLFTSLRNKPQNADGSTRPGDIAAVAYDLEYVNPVDGSSKGEKTFVLYRLEVDPLETFNTLLNPEYRQTLPDKRAKKWGQKNFIKGVNGENYLVSNIVDFRIDFYVEDDGNKATPTLYYQRSLRNPNRSVIYGGEMATVGPQAPVTHYQNALSYAEIKLTVLSDEGVSIMQNIDKRPESPSDVIREYSQVFVRRVQFPIKPL